MSNISDRRLHILPSFLFPGVSRHLNKKTILKLTLALSLIITALSLIMVQLVRAINGQANTLLSQTVQQVQSAAESSTSSKLEAAETAAQLSSVSQTTSPSQSSNNVQVVVNGENVPVPPNGSVSRTIVNSNGGESNVNITSTNTSTGGNSNHSVDVRSSQNSSSSNTTDPFYYEPPGFDMGDFE